MLQKLLKITLFAFSVLQLVACSSDSDEITVYAKVKNYNGHNSTRFNNGVFERTHIVYKKNNIVVSKMGDSHYPNKNCYVEDKNNWYCFDPKHNEIYVSYGVANGKIMREIETNKNGDVIAVADPIPYWKYILYKYRILKSE